MIYKNCEHCQIEFQHRQNRKRFCSVSCAQAHRHGTVYDTRSCKSCGAPVATTISENRQFCSHACAATFNNQGRPRTLATREKIASTMHSKPKKVHLCAVCQKPTVRRRMSCSDECFTALRRRKMRAGHKCGGYRVRGGRGKQGHFDGQFFQSTWEIAFYLFHRDCGHSIKKLTSQVFFKYEADGRTRKFYPDFLVDEKLFEVKGPQDPYREQKRAASLGLVTFMNEVALEREVFPWVREHYGAIEKLHRLYLVVA